MDLDDAFFKSIKDDAQFVLHNEPRPTMYWPNMAEENYMEIYYGRCANRVLSRLPWLQIRDLDLNSLLCAGDMLFFLIDQTPKGFFRPEDLANYKDQVGMDAIQWRLKSAQNG